MCKWLLANDSPQTPSISQKHPHPSVTFLYRPRLWVITHAFRRGTPVMSTNLLPRQPGHDPIAVMERTTISKDVVAAAAGDAAAFERLVAATQSLVCSIALAISRDVEASQEIAQDTFVAVWQGLRKLRSPESFHPWLRQMTRNRAHEYIRVRIQQRRVGNASLDLAAKSTPDQNPNARQRLLEAEQQAAVHAALEELPDETREVLVLYYREGQSVQQVAELLDLTQDAVKKRLSRGRERLREDVEQRLSQTLRATIPTAAFTSAVIAAITFAAPVGATAAGLGIAAKAATPAAISAGVLAGLLGGIIPSLASITYALRKNLVKASDEQERRGLKRLAWLQMSAVLIFCLSLVIPWHYYHYRSPAFVLCAITLYWLALVATGYGQNAVTSRRRNLEYQLHPEQAAKDRRRTVRAYWFAVFVYVVVMAGMIFALRHRGLM